MISIRIVIILFLTCYFCSSCENKSYNVLVIRLDPELEWRMIDSISLSSEDFYSVIPSNDSLWSFDSISHAIVFHCDSMPSTEYVLKIKTIFIKTAVFKPIGNLIN